MTPAWGWLAGSIYPRWLGAGDFSPGQRHRKTWLGLRGEGVGCGGTTEAVNHPHQLHFSLNKMSGGSLYRGLNHGPAWRRPKGAYYPLSFMVYGLVILVPWNIFHFKLCFLLSHRFGSCNLWHFFYQVYQRISVQAKLVVSSSSRAEHLREGLCCTYGGGHPSENEAEK